jgi:hypothetical protein
MVSNHEATAAHTPLKKEFFNGDQYDKGLPEVIEEGSSQIEGFLASKRMKPGMSETLEATLPHHCYHP